jgi:hypothetical protein
MKRLAILFALLVFASPAFAIDEFAKQWKEHYLADGASEEFVSSAKKAGCNVCHVKGGKKTERNEYGAAVKEFLDKKDFPKDFVKANPDKAKEMILAGLKSAGEKKSSDGKTFAEKIAAGTLPATDSGL